MFIVALTGSIASGKSTVLDIFKQFDIPVISADTLAHTVIAKGKPAWKDLVSEFGQEICSEDGSIDREKLGALVFSSAECRYKVNRITHTHIIRKLIFFAIYQFFFGKAFVVMELPLLFEVNKFLNCFHKIITVYCAPDQQIDRLCRRNTLKNTQAISRIHSQLPFEDKMKRSDHVIYNTGSYNDTFAKTESLIHELKKSKFQWIVRGVIFIFAAIIFIGLYIIYQVSVYLTTLL